MYYIFLNFLKWKKGFWFLNRDSPGLFEVSVRISANLRASRSFTRRRRRPPTLGSIRACRLFSERCADAPPHCRPNMHPASAAGAAAAATPYLATLFLVGTWASSDAILLLRPDRPQSAGHRCLHGWPDPLAVSHNGHIPWPPFPPTSICKSASAAHEVTPNTPRWAPIRAVFLFFISSC
jgi:hypothetical protein